MIIFPCKQASRCPGSDYPLGNYSAEDPDSPIFLGYSTGPPPTDSFTGPGGAGPIGNPSYVPPNPNGAGTGTGGDPPPLDSIFDNASVTTFFETIDPDVIPDDEAGNENVEQLASSGGEPGSGGLKVVTTGDPVAKRPPIYANQPQTCTINCPDGSPFSFTVPAGKFKTFSQISADRAAASYACKMAQANQICLGSIVETATVGVLYDQSIIAYTANIPVTFSIISGTIPAWLTATVNIDHLELIGTPAGGDIGASSFTVEATDVLGNVMTRGYTITVSAGAACDPVAVPASQLFTVNSSSAVFCDKTGTIFAIESTTNTAIIEINTSGVVVNSFLIGSPISCIFYENTNQRLYVGYNAAGNKRVASYNPSTRLLINLTTLTGTGPSVNTPTAMTYDPTRNNLWVTDSGSYVWKINANTLAQSVVATGAEFGPENGIVYCANQDKVIVMGTFTHTFPTPSTMAISTWNPSTMAFTYIDAGGISPFDTEEICYNSNNGLAYATASPDISGVNIAQVWVIDPDNTASFVAINLPLSKIAVTACYNPCTDKVIAMATIAGNVLRAYYINTSDNTIAGTVSPGASWLTSQTPMTYDAADARVWLGTGLALIKFT